MRRILGGALPLILRPAEGGRYSLVGEAYIHGNMDGEPLEGADKSVTWGLH